MPLAGKIVGKSTPPPGGVLAKDNRNDPERYLHVLVAMHMVDRFANQFVPRLA